MELLEYIAQRIRELRESAGMSQEVLAKTVDTAANTISRWETGFYKPTIEDLNKLARTFSVSILEFFPKENVPKEEKVMALLRAASDLKPSDLDELRRYAEFRKARALYDAGKRKRPGRKPKHAAQ